MTMVQTPTSARGTAAVRMEVADEPVAFSARRAGRLGPFTLVHLIGLEVAAGAVLGTVFYEPPVQISGAAGALLILLFIFWPSSGRWLYQTIPLRRRLSARQRADIEGSHEVLHELAPDLGITGIEDRDTDIGVGHDNGGWFAVLELGGPEGTTEPVPFQRLARLFEESAVPVSAIQILGHTVPVGVAGYDGSPAATSYQELLAGTPAVVHYTGWLAVRLSARDALDASTERGGELVGVHKALAVTVSRVGKLLRNTGLQNRVLDADGLREALLQSLGLTVQSAGHDGRRAMEVWNHWYADGLQHVTYRVTRWPTDPQTLPHVLDSLAGVPAAFTAVSTVLTPGPSAGISTDGMSTARQMAVEAHVRVAGDAQTAVAGRERLEALADQWGARLERLDGEQGPAAYASAPTGGGPR